MVVIPAFFKRESSFKRLWMPKAFGHDNGEVMNAYYVYIMASKKNGTLYIGVTNNLTRRVYEHKNDLIEGFTKKYGVHKLVYYEQINDIDSEIEREKKLKKWNRRWKIGLIQKFNPNWHDIYDELTK